MQKGFTLIEALLYIALFAIVIGGGMVAVYQIIESTNRTSDKVMMLEEANFIQRKIEWALKGASVDDDETDSDTLTIIKPIDGSDEILVFEFDGTDVILDGNTGEDVALNNTFVTVTDPEIVFDSAENKVDISFRVDGELFSQTKYLY
jgi:hypothetical protein